MAHRALRHGQELVHSFLALRKAVGFIGMVLPFAVLILHRDWLPSISDGFYTSASAVFVASVCAIGIFLLYYRGYDRHDRIASFVAGASALVVGQVPTGCADCAGPAGTWGWGAAYAASFWPKLHLGAAALLFLTLAIFCLVLFPRSDGEVDANPKKKQRNRVYRACGIVILACLAALLVHALVTPWLGPVGIYIGETVMMLAFGFSWAVKGEAITPLNDQGSKEVARPLAPAADLRVGIRAS